MRLHPGLLCLALAALAAPARGAVAVPLEQAQDDTALLLEVFMNGEATGQILAVRQGPRGLLASRADLRQLGLNRGVLATGDGAEQIALDSITGLLARYDAAAQTLALQADDKLRTPLALSAGSAVRAHVRAQATPGALLNYNAVAHGGAQGAALAYLELRAFNERGVFSSSGVATLVRRPDGSAGGAGGVAGHFVRHDSFWVESDEATLRSWRLGDSITSSLAWTRSLRIGGLQWSKSFSLRPDLATFPMPSMGGSAAVPSSLALYVNGMQQYAAEVPGGPFILRQVGGVNGAGEAVLVTRDALGRVTSASLPLYVDARLLAAGLSEYSLEAGLPRAGFGVDSFGYRGAPVATVSGRYGWSDALTIEGHGELAPRLFNGGAGALLALGRFGVASASLAASSMAGSAGGKGVQLGLGYQYVAARGSVDLLSQRAGAGYRDLSARDGAPAARAQDRAALALSLGPNLSINTSYTYYRLGADLLGGRAAPARIIALGLTHAFAGGVFGSLSAFENTLDRSSRGLYLSLSMALGERTAASAVAGRQNGVSQRSLTVIGAPDLAGGVGWGLQDRRQGDEHVRAAQASYLGRYGQLGVTVQSASNGGSFAVDGAGALVLMDGQLAATRSVGAGFAVVSTGGVADVPVLHENRIIGRTDASGHLLVPDLNTNVGNVLAIDTTAMAVDRRVPVSTQVVNPRSLSGMLVRFPIEAYRAANVVLLDAAGKALPVGLPLLHRESGKRSVTGFDGLAFIDDLQAHNHIEVAGLGANGAGRCSVEFNYSSDANDPVPTIGPLRCILVEARP